MILHINGKTSDPLGFPGSFGYVPQGAEVYFNRTGMIWVREASWSDLTVISDVQKAINAPIGTWEECSDGVLDIDTSDPSGISVIPRVTEKLNNTIIAHGDLDFILITNG